MDRKTKAAFGACGVIWLWGMYKQYLLHLRILDLEKFADQLPYDDEFAEIVDEHLHDIDGE